MITLLKLRNFAALSAFLAATNALAGFSVKKKVKSFKKAVKKPFRSTTSSKKSFTPGQTPTAKRSSIVIGSQRAPLTTSQRIEPQQSFKRAQIPSANRSSISIGSQRSEPQSSIIPKKKSFFSSVKKKLTPQSFRTSKPKVQPNFASNIPPAPSQPLPPGPARRSGLRSGHITPKMLQKQRKKLYSPQLGESGMSVGDQEVFDERRAADKARRLERRQMKIDIATQIGSSLVTAGTQIGSAIVSAAAQKRQIQQEAAARQEARDREQRQVDELQQKYLRQQEEIRQLKEQANAE